MVRGKPVPKKSILDIRSRANGVRQYFELGWGYVDVIDLLENHFGGHGVTYCYKPEWRLGGQRALTLPDEGLVIIGTTTYERACDGDPDARFTVAHELGHLCLEHRHAFAKSVLAYWTHQEDSEWQADQFAMELLMPIDGVQCLCDGPKAVQTIFRVTGSQATVRWTTLKQEGEK